MHATEFAKLWSKLSKDYKSMMDESLAPSLTESQLTVLERIAEYGKVKPSDLLPHLATTPAAITTLMDRMEKNALIIRERDQDDRRIVWIQATEFGEQEMRRGVAIRENYWNEILHRISTHNQQLLILLLGKLTQPPQPSTVEKETAAASEPVRAGQ
ncbi:MULTISPECIES: MarR family winged helix-turn-helix transcriptional regulator [Paenibacillus]|uniref:MarR family transcriptional regulator n=2 Tax=Paenibacillus TaxID=44249 RepID=A0AAJ2N3X8_9BACL|nr:MULTISPECIES: MarR family transcriptional regulator [Paenibacillus]EPY12344.1 MarR family transcriptional regulator [Paenibacillus alvei A6-6i-x]MCM3289842.1 MarR family transcriptional regulator [Paenibacillus sp. MER 180]MCY9530655.1 MarR family transcriptional regulator [Paenibacillus alvei]MDT8976171.1 MarR family transcriptional regulator [Paenibacillus sp. chi10]OBY79693.1 transcriptional regulator [Paenibacillus sp. KS1]